MTPPIQASELDAYCENRFDLSRLEAGEISLPLADEPFVAFWEERAAEASSLGAVAALAAHLPQLRFPIRAGISQSEDYRAATRRGVAPDTLASATGLVLAHPGKVELVLYAAPAGRVPLLVCRSRPEFETLLQALTRRNEPEPIPASQGALMVAGFNNWGRIQALRRGWEESGAEGTWDDEFRSIQQQPELYQDRFILLSDGPYSGVPAAELGLADTEWRDASLALRREHECTHYFTKRVLGSMRNNLLDEILADYAGLAAAFGRFRADWFLRFLGIAEPAGLLPGARLEIYRGKPPLSDGAFQELQGIARAAAANVERFDAGEPGTSRDPRERTVRLLALAAHRLEELAAPGGAERLHRAAAVWRERLRWTAA